MARTRRVREREAEVAEETARAALGDQPLGLGVRLGTRDSEQQAFHGELVLHRDQPNSIRAVRAVRIHEEGGPEVVLVDRDVPVPEPGPGEARVRLRASALNHIDIWIRLGKPSRPKPHTLGADGAGVVDALGPGTEGPEPGSEVVINPGIFCARVRGLPARSAIAVRALRGARRAHPGRARRLLRGAGAQPASEARAAELRRGRRLPARVRDRLAHADDARAPAARRVGARVGRRIGRRQRGRDARVGARRARDRHGLARRGARGRARARRGRDDQPSPATTCSRPSRS